MTNAYELFGKEFKAALEGYDFEHTLGGLVFSQSALDDEELFTNREKETKLLASGLVSIIKDFGKKIIIFGRKGIGKSTMLNVIDSYSEKEETIYVHYLPVSTYSFEHSRFRNFLNTLLLHDCYTYLDDSRKKKDSDKHREQLNEIMLIGDTKKRLEKAIENGFCSKESDEDSILQKCLGLLTKPFVFVIDDYHLLSHFPENAAYIERLSSKCKLIQVIALPLEDFNDISFKNPDFTKNSILIKVDELSIQHLCELFAKRVYKYRGKKVSKEIDWDKDVSPTDMMPFDKQSLEKIAVISQGNPLDFIVYTDTVYQYIVKNKVKKCTSDIIDTVLLGSRDKISLKINPELTEKQIQIYNIVLENSEGIQLENIKQKLNEKYATDITISRIIQQLNQLIDKNLATKTRQGKRVFYFPKPAGQNPPSEA